MAKLLSTGQTPQRREFSYPRQLTKTEEHGELRSRFQERYMPGPDPFPLRLTPLEGEDEDEGMVDSEPPTSATSGVGSDSGSVNGSLRVSCHFHVLSFKFELYSLFWLNLNTCFPVNLLTIFPLVNFSVFPRMHNGTNDVHNRRLSLFLIFTYVRFLLGA